MKQNCSSSKTQDVPICTLDRNVRDRMAYASMDTKTKERFLARQRAAYARRVTQRDIPAEIDFLHIQDVLPTDDYRNVVVDVSHGETSAFPSDELHSDDVSTAFVPSKENMQNLVGESIDQDEDLNAKRRRRARQAYASMGPKKKDIMLAKKKQRYVERANNLTSLSRTQESFESSSISRVTALASISASEHLVVDRPMHCDTNLSIHVGDCIHKRQCSSTHEMPCSSSANLTNIVSASDVHSPSINEGRFFHMSAIVQVPWILPSASSCVFCNAKRFSREPPGFCCCSGQVVLAPIVLPSVLFKLFTDAESFLTQEFRRRSRSYNNKLAFTSLGMKTDPNFCWANQGIYTVRVVGQVCHILNDPISNNANTRNLQLLFYESIDDDQLSTFAGHDLSPHVLKLLIEMLKNNPYSTFFRQLNSFAHLHDYRIIIKSDPGLDQRTHNLPTVSQVAAIWNDSDDTDHFTERHIQVYVDGGQSHKINYYFGCYDPLQYPILFPNGEPGWHMGIQRLSSQACNAQSRSAASLQEYVVNPNNFQTAESLLQNEAYVFHQNKKSRTNVSCREYYCYRAQMRPTDQSCILHSGRLGQQFAIDMYIKIETSRLDYYRLEQQQSGARTESYQGLVDSLSIHGQNDANEVGRRVVLPSSFIGGPRDMRKRYVNAMALVQKFGKPDLFLTMTCNPQWQEISDNLLPLETAQDRPDLIARVFRARLEELKHEIIRKKLFGDVAAYVYVIEYQKRGLPHVHWLLILKKSHKLVSSEIYDQIISAELPDPNTHPFLHSYVVKHMMHGPCGTLNPKNVCMRDGRCKNHYPKKFSATTIHGHNCYPQYRRRNDGQQVMVRNSRLDNRWVVPYCPYLLAKFNCHLNVEVCSDIKLVKYLYKYIYKGHDRVAYQIVGQASGFLHDEIKEFQNARWISAPEAYWRIFGFSMSEMHPPVILLHVHQQNQHYVSFGARRTVDEILRNPMLSKTMLTEFFWMNTHNADAKQLNLLYVEFPEYFVWIPNLKIWKLRTKQVVVGRLVTVSPAEGERYFERLLLMHVRSPTSFSDLLTINGKTCSSFREAALQRGLLQSNNYIENCLEEASQYQMPYSLRRLFAVILVYCAPPDPTALWNKFYKSMSEDFALSLNLTDEQIKHKTLQSIDSFLISMGKSIAGFAFAQAYASFILRNNISRDYDHERNILVSEEDLLSIKKLNKDQHHAFQTIINALQAGKGGAFFIDGPGGTGKTYLYKAILAHVRSQGEIALAVATSGVAAALLPGGRTAHSRFKLPLHVDEKVESTIKKQTSASKLIEAAKIILWDEVSMANRRSIECFDEMLQDISHSTLIFGGKVVVFGGDFRQTLPIVVHGVKEDLIAASFVSSNLWTKIFVLSLKKNLRAQDDPAFSNFLLKIGNGIEPSVSDDNVVIPTNMLIPFTDKIQSLNALINFVFPSFEIYFTDVHSAVSVAILAPKNDSVSNINELLINRFPGEMKEYHSYDTTDDPLQQAEYEDFLNNTDSNGLPPHKLLLKVNSPIMLLRNLNPMEGLCNGTRLICRHLGQNCIGAEIAFGHFRGRHVFIPRISLEASDKLKCPIPFKRNQFPVRLCFAMTINKAQGQTLDRVGIYLPEPVFSHGQLYVALSRARNSASVKLLIQPPLETEGHINYTRNIVYKEIFDLALHCRW